MYYPSLEPLKGSEDPGIVERLDETLAALFEERKRRIAPSFVSRELDIPLDTATRVLLKAVDLGVGDFAYEIMCSECGVTIGTHQEMADVPVEGQGECESCYQEYSLAPEQVWVTFRITEAPAKKE